MFTQLFDHCMPTTSQGSRSWRPYAVFVKVVVVGAKMGLRSGRLDVPAVVRVDVVVVNAAVGDALALSDLLFLKSVMLR